MAIEDYYHAAELWRYADTVDDQGRAIKVWSKHSDIMCLINQADSGELWLADKLQVKATHKMYCPVTVELTAADRIKFDGQFYQIKTEPKDTVHQGHHYKVLLEWVGAAK